MKALCRPKLEFSVFNELRRCCLQQWDLALSCGEQQPIDLSTALIVREFPSDPFDQTYSCIRVIIYTIEGQGGLLSMKHAQEK